MTTLNPSERIGPCPPDPDEGLVLKDAVVKRLLQSLKTPRSKLLTPDEMRRKLEKL